MGAQDSLALAEEFVQSTGTSSFTMIWDESFDTWRYYQVTGQPTAILLDQDGKPVQGWRGIFPPEEVLEAVSVL